MTDAFPVGAYFYPFTQKCPEFNERAASIGYPPVDENLLIRSAKPLFDGHKQPNIYCLGDPAVTNWDNADPNAMGLQIDLMQETGLDFALFDCYGGLRDGRMVREYDRPLDVFLQADRGSLGFAVMWCIDAPRIMIPSPPGVDMTIEPGRSYEPTVDAARFIIDECVEKYWHEPGYLHLMGRPYFSLYNTVIHFSETEKLSALHEFGYELKDYAAKRYKIDPYLVVVNRILRTAIADMVDAVSAYALLPEFNDRGTPVQEYRALTSSLPGRWAWAEELSVPFVPPATVGWDASPRGARDVRLDEVAGKYPYTPIVVGSTPEYAVDVLEQTLAWTTCHVPPAERYGIICAWNEISEGAALLPKVVDGQADYSYMNAFAKALKNRAQDGQWLGII